MSEKQSIAGPAKATSWWHRVVHWMDASARRKAITATVASLVAGGVIGLTGYLLVDGFRQAYFAVQFATTNKRLDLHLAGDGDPSQAFTLSLQQVRSAQYRGGAFAIIWGAIGFGLLKTFWHRCWNVGPAINPAVLKFIAAIPATGALIAVIERIVTLGSVTGDESSVALRGWSGRAIVSLAWAKWVLAGATVLVVLAMLVAAATAAFQRRAKEQQPFAATVVPPRSRGTGVSCSGGGIRAASFSLGALSALERWPADSLGDPNNSHQAPPLATKVSESVLGQANYLSSVSGGGYAAAAWRIAAGTSHDRELFARMPPLIGDPNELSLEANATEDTTNLLEHVRTHRSFLATGRGGLPLATIRYLLQTALHLSLLLGFVFMLSWPFGILLRSYAVHGVQIDAPGEATRKLTFALGEHQVVPPLVWGILAAIPWLVRLGTKRGRVRKVLDLASTGFAVLAIGSAFVLIALPWLVVNISVFPGGIGDQLRVTGIYATVLAGIWQFAKRYLQKQAKYLGGVVLAVGVALFALRVVEDVALEAGWLGRLITFVIVSVAVISAFLFANPDKWSLSDFYRKRLAGTFVTKIDSETFHPSELAEQHAPALSGYIGAPGPEPIVCCAASRQTETETGVAALSMTFEPSEVTVHSWSKSEDRTKIETTEKSLSHVEFRQRLPQGKQGERLASLIGAAAISGAAVAPSMGRLNLKTTNALLAAFNARLGVWVPNPAAPAKDRMSAPRVINMFKEIFGVYGSTDPNVYATDGGHWENLGLVELVRKQCDTIIAIDTSGDAPGTYKAFKNAIELAFLECEAVITIDDEEWEQMVPDEDGLLPRNYLTATIQYPAGPGEAVGPTGDLLYVKAAVARDTPLAVQRYAAGDRTFPNYSTANQMLTDVQMTNLFKLGFSAMQCGLAAWRPERPQPAATGYGSHAGA